MAQGNPYSGSRNPFDTMMPTAVSAFRYSGFQSVWSFRKITLRMTKQEVDLFASVLQQNRDSPYLEFGAGGSTMFAAGIVPQMVSVENDLAFINICINRLKTLPKRCTPRFIHIDQGPLGEWGFPETTDPTILRKYAETVWQGDTVPPNVKTVLVDGRFRRACLLHSILHLDSSVDFLLHDCQRYEDVIEEFFVEAKRVDSLCFLHKKPGLTQEHILSGLSKVQDEPG